MSCNQMKPNVFLNVYHEVVKVDTIYYLQITIKNESHIPHMENCRYLSQYLKITDYNGENIKKEFDGWGYFDGRQSLETNYHILDNRKETTDSFINNAVDEDLKRIIKLNFFFKEDLVKDRPLKPTLFEKYGDVLLLNPGETLVQF